MINSYHQEWTPYVETLSPKKKKKKKSQRNQVHLNLPSYNVDHLAQVSRERLEEFKFVVPSKALQFPKPSFAWRVLPNEMFKINFGGAVF